MALFRQSLACVSHCLTQNIYSTHLTARNIKRWVAPTLRELEKRRKRMGPRPPQPRHTFLEWNYDAELFAFAKRLGEEFNDDLLRRAFVQRSYVIQQELKETSTDGNVQDNKELIKEGEAFISACIKQNFKEKYPTDIVNAIETFLTSEATLSQVAAHMGISDLVPSADFPVEKLTLTNTFKAVVAALKRSTDELRAGAFVKDFLISQLNGKEVYDIWDLKNPYEYLLRLLQEKGYAEVEPRICRQSAVNTILANYQIGLYSNKKLLGLGWGESVEIAKNTAALDAILKLQNVKADTV